jgi:hypothetical protein
MMNQNMQQKSAQWFGKLTGQRSLTRSGAIFKK